MVLDMVTKLSVGVHRHKGKPMEQKMGATETIDMYDEDHCSECAICGGHRAAYSDPPVCCKDCKSEWEIDTLFNQWAKGMI